MVTKENIIVLHGHLYLFWTMGVYYTWELSQKYNVVLIVNEDYRTNKRFHNVCHILKIHEIYYFPKHRMCSFLTHRHYSKMFKEIIARHKPKAVVQHDYIGIENMYLFHWSWKSDKNCKNVVVRTSAPSGTNTIDFLIHERKSKARKLALKYKIPSVLLYLGMNAVKALMSFWDNQVLPFCILNEGPYLSISLFSNIENIPRKPLFDVYLEYRQEQIRYFSKLFGSEKLFSRIRCPLETVGEECNKRVYKLEEEKIVAFFPSLIGRKSVSKEKDVLDKWLSTIDVLNNKFLKHTFLMKFHPSAKTNPDLDLIKRYILKKSPFVIILDEQENAIEWILKSKIIVSDSSSTLWYAQYFPTKLAISIDMHNASVSGYMKGYQNILYFDNLSEIVHFDFDRIMEERHSGIRLVDEHLPTLTDFISSGIKPA